MFQILAEIGLGITKTAVNRPMFGRSTKRVRPFRSRMSGARKPSREDALKAIKFLRKTLQHKTERCLLTAHESLGRTASFGRGNKPKLTGTVTSQENCRLSNGWIALMTSAT